MEGKPTTMIVVGFFFVHTDSRKITSPRLLARLSGLQQMMRDLLRGVPTAHANRRFDPQLASLGWYLGRSVYRETYWLREVLTGDTDTSGRWRRARA